VNFAAALCRRENFGGIEEARWVECVANAAHEAEIRFAEEKRHEAILLHADSMFSGDRAAHFDAELDDFVGGGDGAAELFGDARVEEDDGMQVAITGVEDISDFEAVLAADFLDAAKSGGQFGAGDDAVLDVIRGGKAADRAEGVFAALPEEITLGRIAGDADFTRMVRAADIGDPGGLVFDGFLQAVHVHEEHGGAIERESGVNVGFDGAQRPAIEHFARRGRDTACGDFDDGFGGVVHAIENGKERLDRFRQASELHGDFGDETEGALRADEKAGEIVTRGIGGGAADADEFAGRENKLKRQDVIGCDAIRQSVRAAGVFSDVAADRAGFLAGGIRREMEACMCDGGAQVRVHDAGLDGGALIGEVNIEDAVHPGEDGENSALAGERAAGEPRTSAATDDWDLMAIGNLDEGNNVRDRAREYNTGGTRDFDRAVVFIKEKVLGTMKDAVRAEKGFQVAEKM
jgi:hypothetical protein